MIVKEMTPSDSLTLFLLPHTLVDHREHFSPRSNHTEHSRLNKKTSLPLNNSEIYQKYFCVCFKNVRKK